MKRRVLSLILVPFLLFYAHPVGAAEKEERMWQDESIYFLMVDRFNNGDSSNDKNVNANDPLSYQGGDFQGIIDRLDYIQEMGFTAIWLTPIFENQPGGYHGYWTTDYYKTEEHFGSIETFKKLVEEAHKRDMKIILDFVVNHVGPEHPWVTDPAKADWFHEKQTMNFEDEDSVKNAWLYDLPDLNTENPEVKEYLIDAAKWWIKETDIDGYRLDTVKHVPKEFWKDFTKEVKAEKDDFYLLGEVFDTDPEKIAEYNGVGIDGFVNVPQAEEMRQVFKKPDTSMDRLFNFWGYNQTFYENPYLMGTFIDNHDMKRFTRLMVEEKEFPGTRWKLALTYMYTTPGIPILYYGSEIAVDGGEDPDNRRLMNFRADKELIDYITRLGELRKTQPALTRGEIEKVYENDGMGIYKRTYKDQTLLIAINNTTETQTIDLTEDQLEADQELKSLLTTDLVRSDGEGTYKIVLDREESEIYELKSKSGLNIPFLVALGIVYVLFMVFLYVVKKRGKKNKHQKE
ncbi:alpha-amylase family glycosyl hydrolase [Rossellomorea marisflavi]|uniref:alpha-amylase family glycosyl hydrolase n=1 Tax=Rossellomorea marisflavi TaxID=189381 RepID=UPI0006F6C63A|nr:alpha-amylase family glycosyl hydrolase [Rossellomorea marisflavi]KQU60675.1 alpha-amlyase [Bacillus sp. Leaf406]MDW4526156.1 alpha-amylase family glycosyl hydrolase [Rossellomorea marisflavi]